MVVRWSLWDTSPLLAGPLGALRGLLRCACVTPREGLGPLVQLPPCAMPTALAHSACLLFRRSAAHVQHSSRLTPSESLKVGLLSQHVPPMC